MTAGRWIATLADLAAMAAAGLAIWFGWNPLLRYLPNGLATDVDRVAGWLGADTGARAWLGWLGAIDWPMAAVLFVLLLWLLEKLVSAIRARCLG